MAGRWLVNFSDQASDFRADIRFSDPWISKHVMISDLMSHRIGLASHAGDKLEDLGYPQQVIFERLEQLPVAYPFRVGYAYTNAGFTLGAEAAVAQLVFDIGPRPNTYVLKPWDGDTFLYQPTGEMAGGPSRVTFHFDAISQAQSVEIEFYSVERNGQFIRQ